MAALTKMDKAQIKGLMREQGWAALMKFVGLKLDSWRESAITGTNAFEELRMLHTRDGKVTGVLEFFEDLEKNALE